MRAYYASTSASCVNGAQNVTLLTAGHEALAAVFALVRPLARVDEDVRLEVRVLRERLAADLQNTTTLKGKPAHDSKMSFILDQQLVSEKRNVTCSY